MITSILTSIEQPVTYSVVNLGSGNISDGAVSNVDLENMPANTVKGRLTSLGVPQDLTAAQVTNLVTGQLGGIPSLTSSNTFTDVQNFNSGINLSGIPLHYNVSVAGAGTVATISATTGLLTFGTTNPVLTLSNPGTYMINSRVQLKYLGATFAGQETASISVFRNNNGTGNLVSTIVPLRIVSAITDNGGLASTMGTIYTTPRNNDSIQLNGKLSAAPSLGSFQAIEAEITALRLY